MTLLAQWLAGPGREARAGAGETRLASDGPTTVPSRVAWLSLDAGDDDLQSFFAALVVALQCLRSDFGEGTRSVLTASRLAPGLETLPWTVAVVLVNDILEAPTEPVVFVLGDLRLVTRPAIYLALDHRLGHLPAAMRLILATRHDPPLALARYRASGQLAELRLPDLHFTAEEVACFINRRLHPAFSADELARLYALTEGWPASVRLLAVSLVK